MDFYHKLVSLSIWKNLSSFRIT